MSLITPAMAREHLTSSLSDAAIQRIIDGEEQEIISRYGSHASAVETYERDIPGPTLFSKRAILSVTSIIETIIWTSSFIGGFYESPVTLDATDYALVSGGFGLRRLATGTHPRIDWGQRVVVTYAPVSESAKRVLALINLCKLNLSFNGLDSESVGGNEYRMDMGDYNLKREQIFADLATAQRNYA